MRNILYTFLQNKKRTLGSFSLFFTFCSFAQTDDYYNTPNKSLYSIAYSREYVFTEGLYLNSIDFKKNAPITKEQIITDYPKTESDFWEQIIFKNSILKIFISYKDILGNVCTIPKTKFWGAYYKQNLYYNSGVGFRKFYSIGNLCLINDDRSNKSNNYIIDNNIINEAVSDINLVLNFPSGSDHSALKDKMYIYDFQD